MPCGNKILLLIFNHLLDELMYTVCIIKAGMQQHLFYVFRHRSALLIERT